MLKTSGVYAYELAAQNSIYFDPNTPTIGVHRSSADVCSENRATRESRTRRSIDQEHRLVVDRQQGFRRNGAAPPNWCHKPCYVRIGVAQDRALKADVRE